MTSVQGQYLTTTESYTHLKGSDWAPTLLSQTGQSSYGVMLPLSSMDGVIKQEELGRNRALYTVDDKTKEGLAKANARLGEANGKIAEKIKKLQEQIAALFSSRPVPLAEISELQKKIQDLRAGIKAPIDFCAMTARIQMITESTMSDDDKKKAIDAVKKEAGLTGSEMRSLFTGRMEGLYQQSIANLQAFAGAIPLLRPEVERLSHHKSFLGNLYKPHKGGGFFGKLTGAFKKVGHGLGKAVGNHFQNLFSLGRSVFSLARSVLKNTSLMRFFPGLGQWVLGADLLKNLLKQVLTKQLRR